MSAPYPMTIRKLLMATLVMGIAFSLLGWNWGISVFAAACIPLAACLSFRKFLSRFRVLRTFAFAIAIGIIYLFSCGPYIAFVEAVMGYDKQPAAVITVTRTMYAPHGWVVDGSRNRQLDSLLVAETETFLNAYMMEWHWFGGDVGVFVRALISTG